MESPRVLLVRVHQKINIEYPSPGLHRWVTKTERKREHRDRAPAAITYHAAVIITGPIMAIIISKPAVSNSGDMDIGDEQLDCDMPRKNAWSRSPRKPYGNSTMSVTKDTFWYSGQGNFVSRNGGYCLCLRGKIFFFFFFGGGGRRGGGEIGEGGGTVLIEPTFSWKLIGRGQGY